MLASSVRLSPRPFDQLTASQDLSRNSAYRITPQVSWFTQLGLAIALGLVISRSWCYQDLSGTSRFSVACATSSRPPKHRPEKPSDSLNSIFPPIQAALSDPITSVFPRLLDQLPGRAKLLPFACPVFKFTLSSRPDPLCPALRPRFAGGVLDSGVTRPLSHPLTAHPSSRYDSPPTRIPRKAPLMSYARSLARSSLTR